MVEVQFHLKKDGNPMFDFWFDVTYELIPIIPTPGTIINAGGKMGEVEYVAHNYTPVKFQKKHLESQIVIDVYCHD